MWSTKSCQIVAMSGDRAGIKACPAPTVLAVQKRKHCWACVHALLSQQTLARQSLYLSMKLWSFKRNILNIWWVSSAFCFTQTSSLLLFIISLPFEWARHWSYERTCNLLETNILFKRKSRIVSNVDKNFDWNCLFVFFQFFRFFLKTATSFNYQELTYFFNWKIKMGLNDENFGEKNRQYFWIFRQGLQSVDREEKQSCCSQNFASWNWKSSQVNKKSKKLEKKHFVDKNEKKRN